VIWNLFFDNSNNEQQKIHRKLTLFKKIIDKLALCYMYKATLFAPSKQNEMNSNLDETRPF
jgi:hypothetical protein